MPVYQKLVSFDEMFSKLAHLPIIVNDLSNITDKDKENIKKLITSRYTSDMISVLPSCQCGETKGEFAISTTCSHCGTVVKSIIEDDIEPLLWFRRPAGVAPLINPMIWILLSERFTMSGFNLVQWLADSTYRPAVKTPRVLQKFIDSGLPRGYNQFCQNFDKYLEFLLSLKEFKKKVKKTDYLVKLIEENRHAIFSEYIPLPNKSLLIIEETNLGVYIDFNIVKAIDAIEMIMSIDSNEIENSNRVKENRTIKAIAKLSEFYIGFVKNSIAGKTGLFRKHILGSRTNFNFRAVISSITEAHEYDEIYAPWCVGVTAFRPHLINKLMKRGYTLNDSIEMLLAHVEKYSPLIDELLQELIRETRNSRGIVVIENRNPTMLSGSAQTKRITKFKTNPADHTVSSSILTVKSTNADFDGDALNFSICIDNFLADKWKTLEPHYNVFEATTPLEISDNISIPKPVISSISNWIHTEGEVDPHKYAQMQRLLT
jgi:hypothetical protein